MKFQRGSLIACSLVAVLLAIAGTASAKDAVVVTIPSGGAPGAIGIDANGNPLSPGTYAIGTIQLQYSDISSTWVSGPFTTFTMHIAIQHGHSNPSTNYPANVYFRQAGHGLDLTVTGCTNLTDATFANEVLTLGGSDAAADCTVQVSIPQVDPALNFDGSVLVGNLQMDTDPGTHLDTVTTVQVHVMLVFPSATCLKLYNVITDNGVANSADPFVINAYYDSPSPAHPDGTIQNTSPTNPADVVYVVNTCVASYTVDIKINLQGNFKTSGDMNMGLFTSTTFDVNTNTLPGTDFSLFTGPSNSTTGTSACLASQTIPGGNTLLARDKMLFDATTISGNVSNLSGYTAQGTNFTGTFTSFFSGVYVAGSSCVTASTDSTPPSITLGLGYQVRY